MGTRIAGTVVAWLLVGCTHLIVPRLDPLAPESVRALPRTRPSRLVNGQPEAQVVGIGSANIHTFEADLHQWTEIAISTIESALPREGSAPASLGEARSLTISVQRIHASSTIVGCRCRVWISAKASDGRSVEVSGDSWGRIHQTAADGAFQRAVEALLEDPTFRQLLES